MEAKLLYLVILSAATFQLISCQSVSCYDCDPLNFAADCGDPIGNSVRSSPCVADVDVVNGTTICLSAFLNVTGGSANMTGIYRGCRTLPPAVTDFCDWFKEQKQGFNTTVLSCQACNSTRCNTHSFRDDGSNDGHNILATSSLVLIFNTALVMLLSGRQ